ncbi:MAG: neutral zinc metallopeptidase [Leptolyngbyaceae cyanobacterium CSU_1_4]|nr:neutral zinc metallopeptidase [Leptolyngbyaceae cyanobacterium CSU_1_4]
MKWRNMRRSSNVQDVRGGGRSTARTAGGVGIGGVVLALLASLVFGVDPSTVLSGLEGGDLSAPSNVQEAPIDDRDSDFVRAVLGDTEDVWSQVFRKQVGAEYQPPKLVLFSGSVNSACGFAEAATGPFYCPPDQKVYLDMSFFQRVQATAGADADFARSYAIAHEIGHHIQTLLGVSEQVRQLQSRSDEATSNDLSVRLELQADCFAGVWGNSTAQRGLINEQAIKGALDTAAQIGDDYLQRRGRGYVVPESFTHGSSEQRVSWFSRGLKTGDIQQCDTFTKGKI